MTDRTRLDSGPKILSPPNADLNDPGGILHNDWSARALYVGESGAQNWLRVVREPNYPLRDPSLYDLRANRLSALQGLDVNTFVSLGPGDGHNEVELVQTLASQSREKLLYVPVDISLPLLKQAITLLSGHAAVPIAIHADFEESGEFLAHILAQYTRPPVLFGLLGGTLGNLDRGEQHLLTWLRSQLQAEDRILIDLPLAGSGWAPSDEPRLRPAGYSPAFRRFLAEAMRPHDPEAAVTAFEERVELSLSPDPTTGAQTIAVSDRLSGGKLLTFRRYCWELVLRWFESQRLSVRFARCSIKSPEEKFGMGVVLLAAA